MKKKNGFTLVELLAVIIVLSLLITIAVPAVISVSGKIRNKMLCSKISDIETAAKLYVEDTQDYEDPNFKMEFTVMKLVENNYYKKEDSGCNFTETNPCVTSPVDNKAPLDNDMIRVTKKDNRLFAEYLYKPDYCKTK